jgi:putative oxidoreductase
MFDAFTKSALGPLILRLALAVIFLYHGLKLCSAETKYGAEWMKPPDSQPAAVQMAVAWGQLIGGCAMALGFLTRLAGLGLIAIMVGAIKLAHWEYGFGLINEHLPQGHLGYEYNFAIIAMCLALVFTGGGTLSMDRMFLLRRRRAAAR